MSLNRSSSIFKMDFASLPVMAELFCKSGLNLQSRSGADSVVLVRAESYGENLTACFLLLINRILNTPSRML